MAPKSPGDCGVLKKAACVANYHARAHHLLTSDRKYPARRNSVEIWISKKAAFAEEYHLQVNIYWLWSIVGRGHLSSTGNPQAQMPWKFGVRKRPTCRKFPRGAQSLLTLQTRWSRESSERAHSVHQNPMWTGVPKRPSSSKITTRNSIY